MASRTSPFDPEKYFGNPAAQHALLRAAFAAGDPRYIANALGVIARANGAAVSAEAISASRVALDRGLTKDGDPKLSTLLLVLKAAGFALTVGPAPYQSRERAKAPPRAAFALPKIPPKTT